MPTTTRSSTPETDTPDSSATAEKAAATAKAATRETAADTAAAGSFVVGSLRTIVTAPATIARAVADDVVSTVRRPDAVLYLGGLVGLAALGVLEWPVAAVAGAGVAVANGVRRARA